MLSELDQFYLSQNEPTQSYLLALRALILKHHPAITPEWKFRLPFFYFKGKMLCYIWFHKKLKKPYLGFYNGHLLEDSSLIAENRTKIKILLLDIDDDIPVKKINAILTAATYIYEKN